MTNSAVPGLSQVDEFLQAPATFYADQMAQIGIGPFTTKLTFGVDKKVGAVPSPTVTVVLPTAAVLNLVTQFLTAFQSEQVRGAIKPELEKYFAAIAGK